jgi:hypothetical protein
VRELTGPVAVLGELHLGQQDLLQGRDSTDPDAIDPGLGDHDGRGQQPPAGHVMERGLIRRRGDVREDEGAVRAGLGGVLLFRVADVVQDDRDIRQAFTRVGLAVAVAVGEHDPAGIAVGPCHRRGDRELRGQAHDVGRRLDVEQDDIGLGFERITGELRGVGVAGLDRHPVPAEPDLFPLEEIQQLKLGDVVVPHHVGDDAVADVLDGDFDVDQFTGPVCGLVQGSRDLKRVLRITRSYRWREDPRWCAWFCGHARLRGRAWLRQRRNSHRRRGFRRLGLGGSEAG